MLYTLRRFLDPSIFQGKYKKKNYFEGWYYKIISADQKHAMAVIPGISLGGKKENAHSFIQFLDATTGKVEYIRFGVDEFKYSEEKFEVTIGNNFFSDTNIRLSLDNGAFSIKGELKFENMIRFPRSLFKPGIMGPYAFVPFMECIHAVISIHHNIKGALIIKDKSKDYTGGYGYIEKDRGRSFPDSWIWLQSNHFGADDVSFMFSVARIPWLGKDFPGFVSFFRRGNEIFIFATYTGAKIKRLNYHDDILSFIIEDKKHRVIAKTKYSAGSVLKAPKNGLMAAEILESINATVDITMTDKNGAQIYKGRGVNAGLEISDGIFEYIKSKRVFN